MEDQGLKVMILDDEEGILDYMQKILNLKGYQAVTAANGPQALEVFKQESPDICVLDIHLSSSPIDGVEVLGKIKSENQDTECVMVTRITDDLKIAQAKEFGAAHYLLKPLDTKDLIAIVNELATKVRERRAAGG